ncbi:MAG: type II secretion system F family protein [Candidatus Xenobia bacterium]
MSARMMYVGRHPETGRPVLFMPVARRTVATFFSCLSIMLSSGVTLVRALEILADQEPNALLQRIVHGMGEQVSSGMALSDAMETHSLAFTPLHVAMIRAGEVSGHLPEILKRMAAVEEKDGKMLARLRAACTYPAVVLVLSALVLVVLSQTLLSASLPILESAHMPVPPLTRLLMILSSPFGMLCGILVVGAGAVGLQRLASWDSLVLRLPLVGPAVLRVELSRLCRSLATLYGAGVPILQALDLLSEIMQNATVRARIGTLREALASGQSLTSALGQVPEFPPLVAHFASVGEESGHLPEMLLKLAEFYDMEVETALDRLSQALEPFLIVTMGVLVGFIIIVAFGPIYQVMARML